MKRILVVLTVALAAFAVSGLTASAAPPAPESPIVWVGNGTTNGFCNQIIDDPSVKDGDQVWLFILTGPSSSSWQLSGEFADSGAFGPVDGVQKGNGAIHFEVTTGIDDQLLSASATNGQTNSVLTVSHCSVGGDVPSLKGSLSVVKTVVPLPTGVEVTLPDSYTAHVSCSDETEVDVTLPAEGGAGDPAIITGIEDGAICTVEETTVLPTGTVVTYSPEGLDTDGVEVTVEGGTVEVGITNDFTAVEGETVVKPPVTPAAQAVAVAPAFTG